MVLKSADMKLLSFLLLLIFETSATENCSATDVQKADGLGNYVLYYSTDLEFAESANKSVCHWKGSQCYVECTPANLSIKKISVQNDTLTDQNYTHVIFNISTTCSVTKYESDKMNETMNVFIQNMNLTRLQKAQNMCNKTFCSDIYIRAEKEFIKKQIYLDFEGANKTHEFNNFIMTVVKISNTSNTSYVKISAPKLSNDDLPIDVFFNAQSFLIDKVAVVTYRPAQMYTNLSQNNLNIVLKSRVIHVETVKFDLKNITNLLFINFTLNNNSIPKNSSLSCQFYNETESRWDDMGSHTNLTHIDCSNIVTCSYDHMSLFAVLLIDGAQPDQESLSCSSSDTAATTENNFFYNNTDLQITENLNATDCHWGDFQCYTDCTFLDLNTTITDLKNNIVEQNISDEIKTLFFNISNELCVCHLIHPLIDLKDFKKIMKIKNMCNELFASDSGIKELYLKAEKDYINSLISTPFNGTTKHYDQEGFNITVVNMDMMDLNTTDNGPVQLPVPKVPGDLPFDVFVPIEPFKNVPENQSKVAVVVYRSAEQFMFNKSYPVLETKVIGIEIVGRQLQNLSNRLVINFTVNTSKITHENHTFSCQFYNDTAHNWSDMGSFTEPMDLKNSTTVTCSYNHMTPFAVLLVDTNKQKVDPVQWKILSYISYIGCSLSSIFSAITILLYIFMKSSDRDNSIRIHVSLSTAYFLLNTSFLFIEWGASWQKDVCVAIAVIIEYSLLSSFSWMAIEAIHLYFLLVKVFNTYIKKYIVKLSLFGWGVPALLVVGSLCVYDTKPFYGMNSNTNNGIKFCWITDTRFLYGMNITYFSLTFLFNTWILVSVVHQIFKMRHLIVHCSNLPSHKEICTVLGLTFLLGLTWGLVFFTSGYTNYPILYLFCICNTLQGLFLFLWIYSIMKNKRLTARDSTVSMQTRTTKTLESNFID